MQAIQPPRADLRTLSRGAGDVDDVSAATTPTRSSMIPPPKFNWKTRVLLPGAILVALLLLIAYAARDSLLPARAVTVVPVVLKDVAGAAPTTAPAGRAVGSTGGGGGGGGVQAPGWVEADPFPISVSALTDGVVREMLALEGQPIKAGDVVARLVDDDAKLALARAEAELAERQATFDAAQRQWDNPIDATRAVATGEAMVASSRAQLDKLEAEIAVDPRSSSRRRKSSRGPSRPRRSAR